MYNDSSQHCDFTIIGNPWVLGPDQIQIYHKSVSSREKGKKKEKSFNKNQFRFQYNLMD